MLATTLHSLLLVYTLHSLQSPVFGALEVQWVSHAHAVCLGKDCHEKGKKPKAVCVTETVTERVKRTKKSWGRGVEQEKYA